jgi:hypothetical protein
MKDYCHIPPYVGSSGGAAPNIMLVYEKGVFAGGKRAYHSVSYNPATSYYGMFDAEANYSFSTSGGNKNFTMFEKTACTPSAADLRCISGNVLNWALMSNLDISRRALLGFGWPNDNDGQTAGSVFTYSGNYNHTNPVPRTLGQWADYDGDIPLQVSATLDIGGSPYTYSFYLHEAIETNATPLTIAVRSGSSPSEEPKIIYDKCFEYSSVGDSKGICIGSGSVTVRFADDDRRHGVLQKYIDNNKDYIYDQNGPRIGVRRYTTDDWKNLDLFCEDATPPAGCNVYCSNDDISDLYKSFLDAMLIQPPGESTTAYLADMTVRITEYFDEDDGENNPAHMDSKNFTKSPYTWCDDTASECRDTFILFVTQAAESGSTVFSPLHSECTSDILGKEAYFAQDVCHTYKSDLSDSVDGLQNVKTYVVHTSYYGGVQSCTQDSDCPGGGWDPKWNVCTANKCDATASLNYAVAQGGGEYFKVEEPQKFEEILDAAFEAILARASSGTAASVVASGEGQGANIIQAIYYPKRKFSGDPIDASDDVDITWIGSMQNLWFHVDPTILRSTIREDTDKNRTLHLSNDNILVFKFDTQEEQTKVELWNDSNGDGLADSLVDEVYLEEFLRKSTNLWEAGVNLWKRDITADPRNLKTHIGNSTTLIAFDPNDAGIVAQLQPELLAADAAEAKDIMDYVHGKAVAGYRDRTVSYDANNSGAIEADETHVWKLFDNVNSTPKVASFIPSNRYDKVYGDSTYKEFTETNYYKNRSIVAAGGNDGILHFFNLGSLTVFKSGLERARLTGSDFGKELFGFIPYGTLPYMKYLGDPSYCHVYGVDAAPYIFDASINGAAGAMRDVNSWRAVLIGSMRLGGACRNPGSGCTDCVETPVADKGMTSYFALDITDLNPDNWTLLWEFSHQELGFTTTAPSIVRINSDADDDGNPELDTNGEWFVVVASGPTGPINQAEKQFMARSDQQLKIFVLDLRTGNRIRTISNLGHQGTLNYAFGGNLLESTVDPDEDYSDDALYFGYSYSDTGTGNTFNKGGVIRLLTKEDKNPANWAASRLVHGIGPVTASVGHLENINTKTLWTYFGEGRYFYVIDLGANIDDGSSQRRVFGVKDPCYSNGAFNTACTATLAVGANLTDVTTIQAVPESQDGWIINLDPVDAATSHKAERVITNPVASETGAVFFVSFKPTSNICAFSGGDTYLWALEAGSGGSVTTLESKALVQVSTGSIEEQDLPVDLTDKENRRSTAMTGVPPAGEGLSLILPPKAVREIMHIREK